MSRGRRTLSAKRVRRPRDIRRRDQVAIIPSFVDPQRKRKIRLVVALSVAVLLSVALIYTSFSASTEAKEPSQLLSRRARDQL